MTGETDSHRIERERKRELQEESSRDVYDKTTKRLNFTNSRFTDMEDNPQVVLPPPRPPLKKTMLSAKEIFQK